jgi:threonine aldolase
LLVPSTDGKITPQGIEKHLVRAGDQHYAQARVVSITLPTEYGTCYSLSELKELRGYTREKNLLLHIDGARLIYAAHYLGVELIELTQNLGADAVSFGGTKNGLLFGEIVLIYNELAKNKFKYIRKQNMQLPSKMKFISCQFLEFLKSPDPLNTKTKNSLPLWKEISQHGHSLATYLAEGLKEIPEITITQKVQANSVFVKVPRNWIKPLKDAFFFYVWDEETFELRWMISYDFTKDDIDQFLNNIRKLSKEPMAEHSAKHSAKHSNVQESH